MTTKQYNPQEPIETLVSYAPPKPTVIPKGYKAVNEYTFGNGKEWFSGWHFVHQEPHLKRIIANRAGDKFLSYNCSVENCMRGINRITHNLCWTDNIKMALVFEDENYAEHFENTHARNFLENELTQLIPYE